MHLNQYILSHHPLWLATEPNCIAACCAMSNRSQRPYAKRVTATRRVYSLRTLIAYLGRCQQPVCCNGVLGYILTHQQKQALCLNSLVRLLMTLLGAPVDSPFRSGDNPVTLTNVEVKMVQPGVKKPVTTRVYCPMSFYKQAASGKGLVLAVPPATQLGGHPLSCTYGAMLSSQAPVELTATAITAPDGRWATSTNSISVALKDVQPLTAGGCVKVSEQQSVHNIVSNQTLQEPGLVGNRVPRSPEQLCYTKTYQTIGQLGPLKSVPSGSRPAASKLPPGVPACGAVKYSSIVSAEPTTGYQGKLLSAGELTVNIVGCHLTS